MTTTTNQINASNPFLNKGKVKQCSHSVITPQSSGLRLILMPVNMAGKLEGDTYNIVTKRWGKAQSEYKSWYAIRQNFKLGQIQTTAVQSDVWVVHMLCKNENLEIDEKALKSCLKLASDMAKYENGSVHVADVFLNEIVGDRDCIAQDYLNEAFVNKGVNVWIYEEAKPIQEDE